MMIKERNLDGEIIEREVYNPTTEKLQEKIWQLEEENRNLDLTLSLVTASELSTVRTEDLIMELELRMIKHIEKSRKYDKLLVKHKKSARLIAELKSKNGDDVI